MSTERNVGIGDVVEDTARYVRDAAGWAGHRIPPTERLEEELDELLEHVVHTVRLPRSPEVVKVLDPWDMRHRARRGAEWVEDQLEPLRDRLDPVRDHIEALRRKPIPRSGVGEVEDEDDGWGLVEWVLFGLFLEWLSEQELTLSIDVDRALWSFDDDEDGRFEVWNETVFTPTISHAARLGDPVMHGDPVAPGAGSPDVLVGGKPALRACDGHVCTKATPVPHVGAGFRSTYCGVEINGFPALRVGDFVDEGPHGLNPIVAGCPTVSIGPVAPPVQCWTPTGKEAIGRPDLFPYRWRKGQVGHFEGKVVLGVDLDGPFVRVDGTVTAARLWAEETKTEDLPLGDIDRDGKTEALRVTITEKTERALGVNEVRLDVHPLTRRVDEAKVIPKGREDLGPPKPEVEVTREIVELS